MQNIVVDQPYAFVPPVRGSFWPNLLHLFLDGYVRRNHGLVRIDLKGVDRVRRSIAAGAGVILSPNHCRPCDPMVVIRLSQAAGRPPFTMASWHLFKQSATQTFLLRAAGVFSVYREGLDREAIRCSVRILADSRRPLVLFPEGVISRTNDRLNALMEGPAFIGREAARKKRDENRPGGVVIHPVAIRYFFDGDLDGDLGPVLARIERQLSWRPRPDLPPVERIARIGEALLALKEFEHFGAPRAGTLVERLQALIDRLLVPIETEWFKGSRNGDVVARVKALRTAILPDMATGELDEAERARRWAQLADLYLAQQLFFYPPDYFKPEATPEKILETAERIEEDLTDTVTVHAPLRAVVAAGEAIEVGPAREKSPAGDPVMVRLRSEIERLLEELKQEPRP